MDEPPRDRGWLDVLDQVQADLVDLLKPVARTVSLRAGESLFLQGDDARELYSLLSGRLEVCVLSESGQNLALNVLGPGQVFGEIALFDRGRRTATVAALEASRLLCASAAALDQEMRRNPDLAAALLRLAVGRARWISEQMENLAFAALNVRLARRLLYLQHRLGEADGSIAVSQTALGGHVSATREAVSKTMAHWKREGIVEIGRGWVMIRDPDRLRILSALPPTI
ncbi:MAG: Crp/Fnr family transcriptional regulator [bacterium]